jgi:5-dehydro-2-deoxygluconokinase
LTFRPDQWLDLRAFGVAIPLQPWPFVDVILGTDDEISTPPCWKTRRQIKITDSQVSDARVSGNVEAAIAGSAGTGTQVLFTRNALRQGSRIPPAAEQPSEDAAGFPVNVQNKFLAPKTRLPPRVNLCLSQHGVEWLAAARFGNACGAICRYPPRACSNATPPDAQRSPGLPCRFFRFVPPVI